MVDVSSKGLRCRAVQEIPDRRGMIVPLTEGTVMYELDGNLKNLINVHWDDGFASLVGPDSIEIIDSAVTWN